MKKLLLCLMTLFTLVSCQESAQYEMTAKSTKSSYSDDISLEEDMLVEPPSSNEPSRPEKPMDKLKDLKIIKTGSISMEVNDFKTTRNKLDSLITLHNGFVSNEDANKPNDRMQTSVTVKLFPDEFYPFLKSVEPLAIKVHSKKINTSDATKEFTDLSARLKAREDIAERYKAILKRANTIDEIFTVEEKLRSVLEDIEAMKGRIRYINEQVGLSTVTISIFQYLPVAEITEAGFFSKLGHAFAFGWNDILGFILGIAENWHVWLIWGMIIFFGVRWVKGSSVLKHMLSTLGLKPAEDKAV